MKINTRKKQLPKKGQINVDAIENSSVKNKKKAASEAAGLWNKSGKRLTRAEIVKQSRQIREGSWRRGS